MSTDTDTRHGAHEIAAWLRRHRGIIPYLFLVPGGLWLILFFVVPLITTASVALQEGSLGTGYRLTSNFGIFVEAIQSWDTQLVRSLQFGLIVTVLTMLIGYPMAYTIAFKGGKYKNILLLLVIMPFFTSFIIRTISWKFILADQGFVLGTLKDVGIVDQGFRLLATPVAVISGITYNFLPFMVLPIYAVLEKFDKNSDGYLNTDERKPVSATMTWFANWEIGSGGYTQQLNPLVTFRPTARAPSCRMTSFRPTLTLLMSFACAAAPCRWSRSPSGSRCRSGRVRGFRWMAPSATARAR